LDLGCRQGYLFDYLKDLNISLYGMDISESAINMLKARGFDGEQGDMHYFNFNEKFDMIISSHSLEHCPDPPKVIINIYQSLKTNGHTIIAIPIEKKKEPHGAHFHPFSSKSDLNTLFNKNKWKFIEECSFGTDYLVVYRKV